MTNVKASSVIIEGLGDVAVPGAEGELIFFEMAPLALRCLSESRRLVSLRSNHNSPRR